MNGSNDPSTLYFIYTVMFFVLGGRVVIEEFRDRRTRDLLEHLRGTLAEPVSIPVAELAWKSSVPTAHLRKALRGAIAHGAIRGRLLADSDRLVSVPYLVDRLSDLVSRRDILTVCEASSSLGLEPDEIGRILNAAARTHRPAWQVDWHEGLIVSRRAARDPRALLAHLEEHPASTPAVVLIDPKEPAA